MYSISRSHPDSEFSLFVGLVRNNYIPEYPRLVVIITIRKYFDIAFRPISYFQFHLSWTTMRFLGRSSHKSAVESSSEDESRKAAVISLSTRNTPNYVATPGLEINGIRDIIVSVHIDIPMLILLLLNSRAEPIG